MKSLLLLLILPVCALALSCQGQSGVQKLAPDAYEKKISETPKGIILDVRTPNEFAQGHLPNALLIDYYNDDFKAQLARLDKTKPVFVYCASGGRSASASKIMIQAGFKEVYDLQGGFNTWVARGKPVKR